MQTKEQIEAFAAKVKALPKGAAAVPKLEKAAPIIVAADIFTPHHGLPR